MIFKFRKSLAFLFLVLVAGGVLALLTPQQAFAASWSAGRIIDDAVFTNRGTMNPDDIQRFLNSKLASCDTWGTKMYSASQTRAQYGASRGYPAPYTCLKDYSENGLSAAQIIYNVSQQYSINPQVLIVLLQKEQGLVTDDWPWSIQYRSATGYGCPDTAPCDAQYYGLTNQLTWSAKMFRAIMDASPTWYTPYVLGNNYIQWNPNSSCGGTNVNIENRATQALYNYTPYQPNQAALNAGYGGGDGCSSYGNRNFWLYFTDWFGSTYNQVTYVQSTSSGAQYVLYNGKKQALTYDGLLAWNINRLPLVMMSQSTLDAIPSIGTPLTRYSYVEGTSSLVFADNGVFYDINSGNTEVWGGFNNTQLSQVGWPIIAITQFGKVLPYVATIPNDSRTFIMDGGTLRPVTSPDVLATWGNSSSISLSSTYSQAVPIGASISNNIVSSNGSTYLLDGGTKRYTLTNSISLPLVSGVPSTQVTPSTVARYTPSGNVVPFIGNLSNGKIYLIDANQKHHITTEDVYRSLGGSTPGNTLFISPSAMNLLPEGSAVSSALMRKTDSSQYYAASGRLAPVPSSLVNEFNISGQGYTISNHLASLFSATEPVTQFVKSISNGSTYFVSQGTRISSSQADIYEIMRQGSVVSLPDVDITRLTLSASTLTPRLKTSTSAEDILVDKKGVYSVNPSSRLTTEWQLPSPVTVSQATYDWYKTNRGVSPLNNHIQRESGYFCNVSGNISCADQFNMIYVWNLLEGTIYPSDMLLKVLGLQTSGSLSVFVSTPTNTTYASNVFAMVDGKLYYISTPTELYNLGYSGYKTLVSDSFIDTYKQPSSMNAYLFKDASSRLWVLDAAGKRRVPTANESNWQGAAIQPMSVSNYFIGIYNPRADITKSITRSGPGIIYGLDQGRKRGITTYQKYTDAWSPYTVVSDALISIIPEGTTY